MKEDIEVVATRVPEAAEDVPASIDVISGETMRAMGAVTIRDALSLAAGVEVAPGGDGGPASAVPEFWGVREFDAFLLVVDGVPWGGAFNPAIAALSLEDVDHIEVLRGSAPVTFGATSFVGVVHVVHSAAAVGGRYASLRGGSFKTGDAALDLPLPAMGAWKSRLSVDVAHQGFSDPRTAFRRAHANLRMANYGSDRTTWASIDLLTQGQHPASPTPLVGAALTDLTPLDANYHPAGAFMDDARISASFGLDRPLSGAARWAMTASYTHSGQSQFRGFLTDISNTPSNASGFREDLDLNDIYADAHVIWPFGARAHAVVGGDFLFGNGEGAGAVFTYTAPLAAITAPVVTPPATFDRDAESRRQFGGAYVLTEWSPASRVQLSAGLRLNVDNERRGEGAGKTYTRPSGSAGVTVGLWEQGANHVRLFANYRDTFKPAAFDFSLAENEGILEPETARSVEGGVKSRLLSGRLQLAGSVFRLNFNNLVTSTVVDGLPALMNAGVTRFQGVELTADLKATDTITARGTYSVHDGRYVDFVEEFDGVLVQLGGNRFELSARHLASGGVIVAKPNGMFGDVIVKYSGDRFLDKRNTALAPAFVTVDVGAGYRVGRWELRLDGRNLSDRRDAVAASELGDAQFYLMTARRFDVTWALKF